MAAMILVVILLTLFFATLVASTAAVAHQLIAQAQSALRYRRSLASAPFGRQSHAA
jgi:hypothetical protein